MEAGDTLSRIAREYGTNWDSLVYWNQDRFSRLDPDHSSYDPNQIDVGWTLRLRPGVVVDYDAPAPPEPTAEPTSEPIPGSGTIIDHGSRAVARIALTFDMGGRVGNSVGILSWLRDNNVPATIFMTGLSANNQAGQQVLSIVDARADLFDLGNHSFDHPSMDELTPAQMREQLRTAEAAIERQAASNPQPLFRPPYGAVNQTVVDVAASLGYPYTIMWDIDPVDWQPVSEGGPTAQQIVNEILSNAQNGSIVLMHLGGYHTLDALPAVVQGLRDRGFELVTLEAMLDG